MCQPTVKAVVQSVHIDHNTVIMMKADNVKNTITHWVDVGNKYGRYIWLCLMAIVGVYLYSGGSSVVASIVDSILCMMTSKYVRVCYPVILIVMDHNLMEYREMEVYLHSKSDHLGAMDTSTVLALYRFDVSLLYQVQCPDTISEIVACHPLCAPVKGCSYSWQDLSTIYVGIVVVPRVDGYTPRVYIDRNGDVVDTIEQAKSNDDYSSRTNMITRRYKNAKELTQIICLKANMMQLGCTSEVIIESSGIIDVHGDIIKSRILDEDPHLIVAIPESINNAGNTTLGYANERLYTANIEIHLSMNSVTDTPSDDTTGDRYAVNEELAACPEAINIILILEQIFSFVVASTAAHQDPLPHIDVHSDIIKSRLLDGDEVFVTPIAESSSNDDATINYDAVINPNMSSIVFAHAEESIEVTVRISSSSGQVIEDIAHYLNYTYDTQSRRQFITYTTPIAESSSQSVTNTVNLPAPDNTPTQFDNETPQQMNDNVVQVHAVIVITCHVDNIDYSFVIEI